MTDRTARLALPLLQAGQAQKELFHNEALTQLDGILHPAVAAIATASVPSAAAAGDSWIVGADANGAWAGHSGQIVTWTTGGWRFSSPLPGMQVWLKDRGRHAWHDGTTWRDDAVPCAGLSVYGKQVIGAQRPAVPDPTGGQISDVEARAAVSAILRALRMHGLIAT